MPPPDHFLEIAVRPFAEDPELQFHARQAIAGRMDPAVPDSTWENAATTLERHDANPLAKRWRWSLWGVVCLVASICLGITLPKLWAIGRLADVVDRSDDYGLASRRDLASRLAPEQRLIVVGNPNTVRDSDRLEPLIARYPDNRIYYADYALIYTAENGEPPPGFLETADRLDPDNGWFRTTAAAALSRGVVKARKQTPAEKAARLPLAWDVLDEPRLDASLKLLEAANRMPRYDSYAQARLKEQLGLLPPVEDLPGLQRNLAYAGGRRNYYMVGDSFYLAYAIAAKASILADQGKRQEFLALLGEWKILTLRQARYDLGSGGYYFFGNWLSRVLLNLKDAASRLGLDEEVRSLEETLRRLEPPPVGKSGGTLNQQAVDPNAIAKDRGGSVLRDLDYLDFGYSNGGIRENPPFAESDLKPGRMTERTVAGRLFALGICGIIGIASGGCALFRFRHGLLIRRLSLRLTDLLKPADWFWLALGGTLPVLCHQIIYRLTPLGGREWNFEKDRGAVQLAQAAVWAVLAVVTPIVVARWRLRKRLPARFLRIHHPVTGCLALLLAVCAILLAGLGFLVPPDAKFFTEVGSWLPDRWYYNSEMGWVLAAAPLLALSLGWWVFVGLRALCGRSSGALARQMIARLLVPTYLFSLIPTLLLLPANELEEHYWVKHDTVMTLKPEDAGLIPCEAAAFRQKRAELLEMLAPLQEKPGK